MFDLKLIRETPEFFDSGWKRRGLGPQTSTILSYDQKHRIALTEMETWKAKLNDISKQIGQRKAKGENADDLMAMVAQCKNGIASHEAKAKEEGDYLKNHLSMLPNIPDATVPMGTSEKDNKEIRKFGQPKLMNNPKNHVEIGAGLGGMDFETAAKMSGARFVLLKSGVARLERALAQFMLDTHTQEHGYTEMSVPLLVKSEALYGTGQLPKFKDDLFKSSVSILGDRQKIIDLELAKIALPNDTLRDTLEKAYKVIEGLGSYWLIPTAEVSLTNSVMDSITDIGDLPLRMTALSPCFRSEAGAAGKDTHGMIRQHQFYKVELVSITEAEKSNEEHDRMTACAENILKKLDLAFRTITLCTGDMGFSARKTYDIEVWLPGQNTYREISSCSNCGDFQARRMMARYKKEGDKSTKYVHTLNGSGVAVGRCLVAVLENYQQPDGSVVIPDALKPYMGGITKLEPHA